MHLHAPFEQRPPLQYRSCTHRSSQDTSSAKHETVRPQLLTTLVAQVFDRFPQAVASDSSVQPHLPGVPPPPHVCGDVHVPQLTGVPQLLFLFPQFEDPHVVLGGSGVHTH